MSSFVVTVLSQINTIIKSNINTAHTSVGKVIMWPLRHSGSSPPNIHQPPHLTTHSVRLGRTSGPSYVSNPSGRQQNQWRASSPALDVPPDRPSAPWENKQDQHLKALRFGKQSSLTRATHPLLARCTLALVVAVGQLEPIFQSLRFGVSLALLGQTIQALCKTRELPTSTTDNTRLMENISIPMTRQCLTSSISGPGSSTFSSPSSPSATTSSTISSSIVVSSISTCSERAAVRN
uniref:Uncharacterized protein n=1 Tax=Timema cristinae TaxID=61476 RepID=A0A7R9DDZ6_TIMCR|nr:unnamed protein product [Timema cristinae]